MMKRLRAVFWLAAVCCVSVALMAQSKPKTPNSAPDTENAQKSKGATTGTNTGGHETGSLSTYKMVCKGANGPGSCTQSQLDDVMQGLASGRRMHEPLNIKSLTVNPANGAVTCTQTTGEACDEEQINAIKDAAGKSKRPFSITKEIDKASM